MNSETKVLKTIWESGQKGSIKLISKQVGFGIDYTRYLFDSLLKKGEIKPVQGRRDWYGITLKGKRGLRVRQLIKPEESLGQRSGRNEVNTRGLKGNLVEPEEKIFNLGKSIAKAVSLLKRSTKEG